MCIFISPHSYIRNISWVYFSNIVCSLNRHLPTHLYDIRGTDKGCGPISTKKLSSRKRVLCKIIKLMKRKQNDNLKTIDTNYVCLCLSLIYAHNFVEIAIQDTPTVVRDLHRDTLKIFHPNLRYCLWLSYLWQKFNPL